VDLLLEQYGANLTEAETAHLQLQVQKFEEMLTAQPADHTANKVNK
jgi:hypothetical protein